MYATLMVHLDIDADHSRLLAIAGELAARFDADVLGIMACQPVSLVVDQGLVPAPVFETDRTELEARMRAAEEAFRAAFASRPGRAHWRAQLTAGASNDYVVQQMRGADLLITGADTRADAEDLVMRIGRPALTVPAGVNSLVPDNVLVGWKDTRETRRAVADALPFLELAKRVVVAEVVTKDADLPGASTNTAEVCAWLQRHGVHAEPRALVTGSQYVVSLDAMAEEMGAELIVAGAYGHSRMREWALGGVTRDLLKFSRRCALLSH